MSEFCSSCPAKGLTENLVVCADPAARCVEFRGRLRGQVEVWDRLARMAELSRGGSLDMLLLQTGDRVGLLASKPGQPFKTAMDRFMMLTVMQVGEEGQVEAVVDEDTYNKLPADAEDAGWAIPEGEEVTLHGASLDGEQKRPGVLIAGMHVDHTWRTRRYGLLLQEIIVSPDQSRVQSPVFGTDLSSYRGAPVLDN